MIYQLWQTADGEIQIVNGSTAKGQQRARALEKQGCDFAGTVESDLSDDAIRDGIAKKYIELGMEATRWIKRLAGKIEEAYAIVTQMQKEMETYRHDQR